MSDVGVFYLVAVDFYLLYNELWFIVEGSIQWTVHKKWNLPFLALRAAWQPPKNNSLIGFSS